MKNKVIRGVLAAACVTTAVSAANVFGAGTEQSLVNEASAVTQEETEETSEAETTDENTPEMTETETPDSTAENAASDLPAAEVQSGKPEETAVSVQAGSYYPWVNENGIWYFKVPENKLSNKVYRMMESYEEDFPEALVKLRHDEEDYNTVLKNVRMIKGERSMYRIEANDLVKKQLRIKKYSVLMLALLVGVLSELKGAKEGLGKRQERARKKINNTREIQ